MTQPTRLDELYIQFTALVTEGKEGKMREFLTDHFNEFPEELQGEILRAFLSEGISRGMEIEKTVGRFQDEAAIILQKMERLSQKFEDKQRLGELEQQIKS